MRRVRVQVGMARREEEASVAQGMHLDRAAAGYLAVHQDPQAMESGTSPATWRPPTRLHWRQLDPTAAGRKRIHHLASRVEANRRRAQLWVRVHR